MTSGLPALPALPTLGTVTRHVPPGGARREWQQGRVVEIRRETPMAKTFRIALPGGYPHTPGQHYVVRVTAQDGSQAARSYSVASDPALGRPADAGPVPRSTPGVEIELTIERIADGDVSPYLHAEVSEGDELEVRGPFGGWFVWRGDTPVLLIGGGSGVVPLMSMLRFWRSNGRRVPLALVLSVRRPSDLFYAGEYGPESTMVWTRAAPEGSGLPVGRLSAEALEPALAPMRDAGATTYVCGSAGFAEHASQLAVGLGMPPAEVRVERFGPS